MAFQDLVVQLARFIETVAKNEQLNVISDYLEICEMLLMQATVFGSCPFEITFVK